MADEWTKVELTNSTGFPRRYTCGSGDVFTKGQVLSLVDPRTASGTLAHGGACAGIVNQDKDTTDTSTTVACWTDGIFEATVSGVVHVGDPVMLIKGSNRVDVSTNTSGGAYVIGWALEEAGAGERINVRLRL